MPSSSCLRRFAYARLLRAMVLLAWLLTAIPPQTTYAGVIADASCASTTHAVHASAATSMHGLHAGHCCGSASHPACHCTTICAAALLATPAPVLHKPLRLTGIDLSMRGIHAPSLDAVPPLRPPAA
jgi:hypothetical protein